jgi:hypothetical protein
VVGIATLVVLAGTTLPGAWLTDFSTQLRPPLFAPAPLAASDALPWLHVAHPAGGRPFIADPEGRMVVLRGVNSGGLVDYWSGTDPANGRSAPFFPVDRSAYDGRCPANSAAIRQPPLCRDDLAQMHALGFDVVRLALSWSLLEPRPGVYDRRYVDRIAQVVGWARAEGMYVILGMQGDGWSRYLGRPVPAPLPGGSPTALNQLDGAPAWATISDLWPSEVYLGQRELNPAGMAAWTNFWVNRRVSGPQGEAPGAGLQDHYVGALATLARRFQHDSTVAGYDLFNEPWPGFIPPPAFDELFLFPFYRRAIDALTGAGDGLPCPTSAFTAAVCGYPDLGIHDRSHLFFIQPDHLQQQVDVPTGPPLPFSAVPNLVLTLHVYTHVFTLDALAGRDPRHAGYPPGGLDLSYASGSAEASALGAALFIGEFGNPPAEDGLLLAGQLGEQERHQVGATLWTWKENCSLQATWGMYDGVSGGQADQRCAYDRSDAPSSGTDVPQNGCLRPDRERLMARVWPRAVAAGTTGLSYAYDPGNGRFQLRANAPAGSPDTILFVPREVRGKVVVSGAASIAATAVDSDGGRLVRVRPSGGAYRVVVQPAPLSLSPC